MPHFECGAFDHSATSPRWRSIGAIGLIHGSRRDDKGLRNFPTPCGRRSTAENPQPHGDPATPAPIAPGSASTGPSVSRTGSAGAPASARPPEGPARPEVTRPRSRCRPIPRVYARARHRRHRSRTLASRREEAGLPFAPAPPPRSEAAVPLTTRSHRPRHPPGMAGPPHVFDTPDARAEKAARERRGRLLDPTPPAESRAAATGYPRQAARRRARLPAPRSVEPGGRTPRLRCARPPYAGKPSRRGPPGNSGWPADAASDLHVEARPQSPDKDTRLRRPQRSPDGEAETRDERSLTRQVRGWPPAGLHVAPQPGRTIADRSGGTPWGKPCHRPADSEGGVCLQGSTPRSGPAPPGAAKPTRQAGLPGPKQAVSLDSGRGVPIDAGRMAVRPVGCAISISRNPD